MGTSRCGGCGAIRGETVAPPRSEKAQRRTEYSPAAERKRNMVLFYLAIWIPIAIWIIIVFFAC